MNKKKPMILVTAILLAVTTAMIGFWALCIALVGAPILFTLNKDPNKDYFGYRAYNVRSNSMAPNADGSSPPGGFYKGDIIFVGMVRDPQKIKEGDIVTFDPNPNDPESMSYQSHRVVRILTDLGGKQGLFFVTKGDHNKSEDPPIAAASVIGKKVFMVPKAGTALELIRKNFALAVVTIFALFSSLLMLQWYFAKPNAKGKKAKQGKDEQQPPMHVIQSVLPG